MYTYAECCARNSWKRGVTAKCQRGGKRNTLRRACRALERARPQEHIDPNVALLEETRY